MPDSSDNWRSCLARTPQDRDPPLENPPNVSRRANRTGCSARITVVPQGADAANGILCLVIEQNGTGRGQTTIPLQIRPLNSHS
jgi:hypothetical protein